MQPLDRPTFYFIGVSTGKSSINQVFPEWMRILGEQAVLVGYDAPLHAAAEVYREIVEHIKADPLARGALVTTHKLDLLDACRDLFDFLDPYAELCAEVSCIAKRDGKLEGYAKDPISSGRTWQSFIPAGHFGESKAEVLCLGSGGAAVATSVFLANRPDIADRPARFTLVDVSQERLDHAREIHGGLKTDIEFRYRLNADSAENDQLMAALPPGSVVINATGMGKDRPGSPITDAGLFPQGGYAWEFNYRGELNFLHQARRQVATRNLTVEDGWVYFLHGWTQVVAQVFQIDLTADVFARLDGAASALR
ncbi:MAG: shikimate dehydrogenase [Anaerolineae bacterium]|nr:shikimate dehydrogenase [Anaerolineae bacterium]